MAGLRKEEVRQLRHACQCLALTLGKIRRARADFGKRPAYLEWQTAELLRIPEALDASVFRAVTPLDDALALRLGGRLAEAREAAGYAAAAIDARAWDDATADMDRCVLALEDAERALGHALPKPLMPWRSARLR